MLVHACTHPSLSCYFQNDLLTEAFGSNKKKRAMASRHRNKVDKNELNETVSDVLESLAKEPMDTTGLLNYIKSKAINLGSSVHPLQRLNTFKVHLTPNFFFG